MINRIIACFLACSVIFVFSNCEDETAATPAKPTLSVNATSGLVDVTEFTFTIQPVEAQTVTLYPYGLAQAKQGTVPVTFDGGPATVKFKYANVGTYDAVVVSNNHTDDGSDVKNTISDAVSIAITSDKATISEFSLDYITGTGDDEEVTPSDSTEIDQGAGTITVYVPYTADVAALTANFEASPFSTVKIGGTNQTSGEGKVNFSSPVTYTVTANNGTSTKSYQVTVEKQDVETNANVKSASGTLYSTSKVADDVGTSIPGFVGSDFLVLYALDVTTPADFDSVSVAFELDGKFSTADAASGDSLSLATSKTITVEAQDGTEKTYTVYAVEAPEITFELSDLNPEVTGSRSGFDITFDVLEQTDDELEVSITADEPAGVNITGYQVKGVGAFTSGDTIEFGDEPVVLEVTVNDSNINETYTVTYTLSLNKL